MSFQEKPSVFLYNNNQFVLYEAGDKTSLDTRQNFRPYVRCNGTAVNS